MPLETREGEGAESGDVLRVGQPWRSAAIATTMRLHYPSCCTALRLINESDHKMCDNLLITLVVRCGRDLP